MGIRMKFNKEMKTTSLYLNKDYVDWFHSRSISVSRWTNQLMEEYINDTLVIEEMRNKEVNKNGPSKNQTT